MKPTKPEVWIVVTETRSGFQETYLPDSEREAMALAEKFEAEMIDGRRAYPFIFVGPVMFVSNGQGVST